VRTLKYVTLFLVLLAAGFGASFVDPNDTQGQISSADKFFVCKYTGTPGVDEVLQTGQNPISVSKNAIPQDPVVVGSFFADAQGRSFVLAEDVGQPKPPASDCPSAPPPTTSSTTTTTPTTTGTPKGVATAGAICDIANQRYNVVGTIDDAPATVSPTTIPGDKNGPTLVTVTLGADSQQVIVNTNGTCVAATTTTPTTTGGGGSGGGGTTSSTTASTTTAATTTTVPNTTTTTPSTTSTTTPTPPTNNGSQPPTKPKPKSPKSNTPPNSSNPNLPFTGTDPMELLFRGLIGFIMILGGFAVRSISKP
jgi:hypothetical protein